MPQGLSQDFKDASGSKPGFQKCLRVLARISKMPQGLSQDFKDASGSKPGFQRCLRVLARISKMPVQSRNSKLLVSPDLAI